MADSEVIFGFGEQETKRIVASVRKSEATELPKTNGIIHPITPYIEARINGNVQDGTNKRWFYGWVEIKKSTAGYGGWVDVSGGRAGLYSDSAKRAYNRCEEINADSGLYGNGVDSANLTGTFDIQPIPDGLPVRIEIVAMPNGTVEYWFNVVNGVDGSCDSGASGSGA